MDGKEFSISRRYLGKREEVIFPLIPYVKLETFPYSPGVLGTRQGEGGLMGGEACNQF